MYILYYPLKLRHFLKILTLAALLGIPALCKGQQAYDYKVYANIIYQFTKYMEWPDEAGGSGPFVIGVVGDLRLHAELKSVTENKTVDGQKIIVRNVSTDGTFNNCHILFLSPTETSNFKKIELITRKQPVVLITKDTGLARRGASVNFVTVDNRLQLEINKKTILSKNINIASELLKLATIVD